MSCKINGSNNKPLPFFTTFLLGIVNCFSESNSYIFSSPVLFSTCSSCSVSFCTVTSTLWSFEVLRRFLPSWTGSFTAKFVPFPGRSSLILTLFLVSMCLTVSCTGLSCLKFSKSNKLDIICIKQNSFFFTSTLLDSLCACARNGSGVVWIIFFKTQLKSSFVCVCVYVCIFLWFFFEKNNTTRNCITVSVKRNKRFSVVVLVTTDLLLLTTVKNLNYSQQKVNFGVFFFSPIFWLQKFTAINCHLFAVFLCVDIFASLCHSLLQKKKNKTKQNKTFQE